MRLAPIGWASHAKNLIADDVPQNPMAATIKIVKKRTTRFKCVDLPGALRSLTLFQASPI